MFTCISFQISKKKIVLTDFNIKNFLHKKEYKEKNRIQKNRLQKNLSGFL